jgi:hypothetical protein
MFRTISSYEEIFPESNKTKELDSKHSIFDAIKKPPSVTMEKIQSATAATLDRMTLLQQRYRQHKEAMAMNSDSSERSRSRASAPSTPTPKPDNSVSVQWSVYVFDVVTNLHSLYVF